MHWNKSPGGSDHVIDMVGKGEEWGLEWFVLIRLYWTGQPVVPLGEGTGRSKGLLASLTEEG